MRFHALSALASLMLTGCLCVDPSHVTGFACEPDGGCESGEVCCSGVCIQGASCTATPCDAGVLCGTSCADTQRDRLHCGACNTSCASNEVCTAGHCVTENCGGLTCASTEMCVNAQCVPATTCGNANLDGDETDVDCGGAHCMPCAADKTCLLPRDCASGECTSGHCAAGCSTGGTCGSNSGAPCKLGALDCTGATPVCTNGGNADDGTACAANSFCRAGQCVTCVAGASCSTNPNPCHRGALNCTAGRCDDGPGLRDAGTACGTNRVCSATGQCQSCSAGQTCSTNPAAPCKTGVISCATGTAQCVDGPAATDGINCGTGQVCIAGSCSTCAPGAACTTNPTTPCKLGNTVCAAATSCSDGINAPAGWACDGGVCNGSGQCLGCVNGSACTNNPGAPCKVGVTSCSGGVQTCIDAAPATPGTSCGTNLVCNASGACTSCVSGQSCTSNPRPCFNGAMSCTTGSPTCADTYPKSSGATCPNGTCDNAGFCGACVPNSTCVGNPNPCKRGLLSCGSSTTCTDSTLTLIAGTSCGANRVCDAQGSCVACTAGRLCTSNPGACKIGVTACTTGTETCVDTINAPVGTSCGAGRVCDAAGACTACAANSPCTTNASECRTGVISCVAGTGQCIDSGNKNAGLPCDGGVCNGLGSCTSCTAGQTCTTNPNSTCRAGVTSCATGVQTCVDGAPRTAGTACGSNLVCDGAGACNACTANQSCTANPTGCKTGVISCITGAPVCTDSGNKPAGTVCGTNQVCNGSGACVSCTAGQACTGNPSTCRDGLTSCATGASTCVDGAPKAMGTACGAGQQCDGMGFCGSCTSGQSCSGNPNPCFTGVTACTNGVTSCANGTQKAAGTACGTNLVCSATGSCVSCTPNLSCTSNPGICRVGSTRCDTGAQTCVDAANKPAGVSCGLNQVCNGGGQCVTCASGSTCSGNPTACRVGSTNCSTGAPVCEDTAALSTPGTSCGTNQVCDAAGVCRACVAGLSCDVSTVCRDGVISCATGSAVCVDGPMSAPGTSCGLNMVCSSLGTCVACTAGATCSTNPSTPCRVGTVSCSTGTPVCVDGAARPLGARCGGTYVCDGLGQCSGDFCASGCLGPTGACELGTTTAACGSVGGLCQQCDVNCGLCSGSPRTCSLGPLCN